MAWVPRHRVKPGRPGRPRHRRRHERRRNNIVHWTEFDTGGHFAAMEVPDLLVADIRAFFRLVR